MSEVLNNYYSSPNFRTCKNVQNSIAQNQAVSNPNVQQYPNLAPLSKDTVSFGNSEQTKQQGMSKGAKWGIGLGLTALAGVGVYLATKGKVGTKPVKQLAEHIEFKEAKTVEEAIEFGKKHLGIEKYDGFGAQDLDIINWFNEGFATMNNKCCGKIRTPKIVKYTEIEEDILHGVDRFKRSYIIDKKTYQTLNDEMGKVINEFMHINKNGKVVIPNAPHDKKNFDALMQMIANYKKSQKNNTKLAFKDLVQLDENLRAFTDCAIHGYNYEVVSPYTTIFHEGTHLLDSKLLIRPNKSLSVPKEIAEKVSGYAATGDAEYIAEYGRRYLEGHSLPKEATEWYKKLGGPKLG